MTAATRSSSPKYTVPGVETRDATEIIELLQDRLNALNDLALTLKHIHWNVVGPNFIAHVSASYQHWAHLLGWSGTRRATRSSSAMAITTTP